MCLLESLFADIRFAVRWLRKSPGFTLVAVASLAIGIGFNTALFAIVDAVLFKPLPVAEPARLVDIFTSDSTGTVEFSTSSYPDYLDLNCAERRSSTAWSATARCSRRSISTAVRAWRWARSSPAIISRCSASTPRLAGRFSRQTMRRARRKW